VDFNIRLDGGTSFSLVFTYGVGTEVRHNSGRLKEWPWRLWDGDYTTTTFDLITTFCPATFVTAKCAHVRLPERVITSWHQA
jgi:hypothetical protein